MQSPINNAAKRALTARHPRRWAVTPGFRFPANLIAKFGMRRGTGLVPLAMVVLLLAACTRPIIHVENIGLSIPSSVDVTMEKVEIAIFRAAADGGWSIRQLEPGRLEAEIRGRNYKAVVWITHDTRSFSIIYKDSRNLDYDGTLIRWRYNNWIVKLRKSILRQAVRLE